MRLNLWYCVGLPRRISTTRHLKECTSTVCSWRGPASTESPASWSSPDLRSALVKMTTFFLLYWRHELAAALFWKLKRISVTLILSLKFTTKKHFRCCMNKCRSSISTPSTLQQVNKFTFARFIRHVILNAASQWSCALSIFIPVLWIRFRSAEMDPGKKNSGSEMNLK